MPEAYSSLGLCAPNETLLDRTQALRHVSLGLASICTGILFAQFNSPA